MWLLIFVVGLVVIIVIALQVPAVQNFAAQKGASYLSNTLQTRVDIGGLTTDWRNSIVLNDIYVEDQQQDTLWHSQRLGVDLKIFSLLKGQINIGKIDLQHATVNIHVRPDSSANYDFILAAFTDTTTQATPADTTAGALAINLDLINLQDVYLDYNDEAGGSRIYGRIGQLLTTMEALDLDKEQYLVDAIELRNTGISFVQSKLAPEEEESKPLTMEFGLNRVLLENLKLSYLSTVADQRIELNLGKSELVAENIDLPNAEVDLSRFDLHNTSVLYTQEKYKSSDSLSINPAKTVKELDESVEETQGQPVKWVVRLADLNVSGLHATVENNNMPQKPGMDIDHLKFNNIELDATDIVYTLNKTSLALNQLKLEEKSGFRVNNFQADITLDSTHARLANLDLQTGNSHIKKDLAVRYTSFDQLSGDPGQARLALDIDNTRIGMQDVLYFAPDLNENPSFKALANTTVQINGRADGQINNLSIPSLQISGLKGTVVDVSGNVRNAMDPDNLYLNMDINRFATTRTDILALSPPGTLPDNIRIPATISMTGNYKGSLTNFDARANIRSSVGNLNAVVDMGQGPAGAEPFTATINTPGLDLSRIFTDSLGVGTLSMQATIKGTGLDPETMQAVAKAQIREVTYNNYTYKGIGFDANINRNLYNVKATSADENIAFDLAGEFNLRNSEQPAYAFDLNLQGVNLQALNFYDDDLALQGQLSGNFTGADANTLNGTLTGNSVVLRHQQVTYPIDSLQLSLNQSAAGADIRLNSNILAANVRTENKLETFAIAVQKHFSNYFDLQPDTPYPAEIALADFEFYMQLKRGDILATFVPGLERLQPTGPFTGSYNAQTRAFAMDGGFTVIQYTDYILRDLGLQVRSNREQLNYTLGLRELLSPSFRIENVTFDGSARDNDMVVRLAMAENNGEEKFVIGGLLNSLGPGFRFAFDPEQLVINSDRWTVPAENFLQYDTNILYANNIQLQRGNSSIALNSVGPLGPNTPLQVQFNNFDIGYIMESFQEHDSLIVGTINGEATIENLMEGNLAFTSDLKITELAYEGMPVGDISLVASSAPDNRYNVDARLTGNGNQLVIDGFLEMQPNATLLNMNANIAGLNLASLEGFTAGMVENMGGNATGKLRITGTVDDPNILGDLNFNQAQFTITMLGSLYRLQNERLVFNEQGINFPNFTLSDSLNNKFVVTGNVFTQNYTDDYRFDLKANTDRFLALNSTNQDNELFYGTVFMAANAAITGDMAMPRLALNVNVLDGSDFTSVVPAEQVGAAEREGIVEFVNLNETLTAIVDGQKAEDSVQTQGFVGADMEVRLSVTDATPITIIIDPTTGDNLVVRGNADPLMVRIDPGGQINMSGRYTITEGKYSMDFYGLAARELDIAKDSYIAWTGDPMQANMNITAIYRLQTAPRELVAAQSAGTEDPALRNQLPFEVYVNVEGEILKPEIGFDIQLPESELATAGPVVVSSLTTLRQDESEMNKQVFALLVLGRFLAPDPLASSGGGLAASARGSLGSVMTDQLNNLTDRYAGGLGLELGVNSYEDYSSGSTEGRTDLNVAMRQQFLDDRLTVRVGTDIGLEGQSETNRNMSGFGGDISVEYSLTEDGRLRVRGFQRNQYEGVLDGGDVRATGAALIFVREYDNFSDLFRSVEDTRAREADRRRRSAAKIDPDKVE